MTKLDDEINSLQMQIVLDSSYLYRLEKLIGDPDENQENVKREIAKTKKELRQIKAKREKLLKVWYATEYKK